LEKCNRQGKFEIIHAMASVALQGQEGRFAILTFPSGNRKPLAELGPPWQPAKPSPPL